MNEVIIPKVKVRNMLGNGLKEVPNQFLIIIEQGVFFQSYEKVIAFVSRTGDVILDKTYWDFSSTTGKYRNKFLGDTKKETERKIKDGTYTLLNLNESF